ncbi:hypothetical protein L1987_65347 [Smallanthus sonchifolius]|uniref:Uncharacterized protein n=1 Tax=Smallanthus sonchifolius TaxID=185202 RepID=A0ACB9BU95_9ASTR|nr:hypothetical protein L1987_65347 [Smallanthus sonchifolius]
MSPMEGSTSNPRQQGDQDQISQSPQDYTNLDGDENQDVPQDQNVNEDASVEEENLGGEEDVQLKRKHVFPRYAEYEPHFKHVPTEQDWKNVQNVCDVLSVFKVCTNTISGSEYPTANLYLMEALVWNKEEVKEGGDTM